jgi:hypothetical protein
MSLGSSVTAFQNALYALAGKSWHFYACQVRARSPTGWRLAEAKP